MRQKFSFLFFILFIFMPISIYGINLIGIEDGLSSRQVYSIEKDKLGFMWFLTHEGIDKYNGKFTIHYKLKKKNEEINSSPETNFLRKDSQGNIIELGRNGYIFVYNYNKDRFDLACDFTSVLKKEKTPNASSVFMDSRDRIWINTSNKQYIFNNKARKLYQLKSEIQSPIVCMEEVGDNTFCISTINKLYTITLNDSKIKVISSTTFPKFARIDYLYFHKRTNTLLISTPFNGLHLYDYNTKSFKENAFDLNGVFINSVAPYADSNDEVLIATNGSGLYKLDIYKECLMQFGKQNSYIKTSINNNIIKDIYIDKQRRVWMAVFPFGITISQPQNSLFKRIEHSDHIANSLVDNQVNYIFEDSDKDIWFLTNNGVSYYNKNKDKWTNFLYSASDNKQQGTRVFLSIIEFVPGKFMLSGYTAGLYLIDKKENKIKYYPVKDNVKFSSDKYISSIYNDEKDVLWLGGYSYLKRYNIKTNKFRFFNMNTPVSYISKKNDDELWIGTYNGLFYINKNTFDIHKLRLMSKNDYITCVYQHNKEITFIATNGNGIFQYNCKTGILNNFHQRNTGLNSNYVYNIVPLDDNHILLSTEKGISCFKITDKIFLNWGEEKGLSVINFNPRSGIKASDGTFYFGGGNGVTFFTKEALKNMPIKPRMFFSNLKINYQNITPSDKNSPLTSNINDIKHIKLKHDQNTISIKVSSINYDSQSNIFYSWLLEGFHIKWTAPSFNDNISYIKLPPGDYKLRARSILTDNLHIIQERAILITIAPPIWGTVYAQIFYIFILSLIAYASFKYLMIKKERNMSKDKIRFFINTAHDIRTPLSLIKAPLGEIIRNEKLSEQGISNMDMAMKNADTLTELTNNLINFEKEEMYSDKLKVQEVNLNNYICEYIKDFLPFAHKKSIEIDLHYNSDPYMNVLIDKHKIDSIIRNILGNALKYTNNNGHIDIIIYNDIKRWTIQISDTGIGMSDIELKKLFRIIFRSHNATNMQILGSGIGMFLTYRLIKSHQGKITVKSSENIGTSFIVSFPFKSKKYIIQTEDKQEIKETDLQPNSEKKENKITDIINIRNANIGKKHILVVEDNPGLRLFLVQSLSKYYKVSEASDGLEALSLVKSYNPDLVISDIMMPIMDGNEMCMKIKDTIETCHVPVILLTALNDKDSIIKGLQTKADKYVTKPFDFELLMATIENIFANRQIIKEAFAKGNFNYLNDDKSNNELDMDQEFLLKVVDNIKKNIAKDINVEILCSNLNMSRSSFYNKIKALTEYSPSDYIRKIKMAEAAKLLLTKKYTVAEVADMVGFGDPKYFTDIFKKHYNMTPSAYMRQK